MRPNKELQELHRLYNKCEPVSIYGVMGMIGKCRVCGAAMVHYVYEPKHVWHRASRETAAMHIRLARKYDRRATDNRHLSSQKIVALAETGLGKTSRAA